LYLIAEPMALQVNVRALRVADTSLIENLQISVQPGVIHTIMGASGSGKSSLLGAICGTLAPGMHFEGDVLLNGQRIDHLPTEARRVGILFQEALLFAHMTVRENLLFAVPSEPRARQHIRHDKVRQGLQDIEMLPFADADPATLSGGQRARVALMRALLAEPQALLLDEPFSKLDADLRIRLRQFVFQLVASRNLPVLLVTHDDADIADIAHLTRLE
jgi:putative thiamine transport system ATP-binding protein